MSKHCIKCDQEIPDNANFCVYCGERQPIQEKPVHRTSPDEIQSGSGTVPTEILSESDAAQAETQSEQTEMRPEPDTAQTETRSEIYSSAEATPPEEAVNTSSQNRTSGFAKIGIAMAVLILLVAGTMLFFRHGSATENAMIWVEDGSYMYSRDITSDADPIEITSFRSDTSNASGYAAITADGKYAYLLNRITSDSTGTLYRVELNKLSAKGDKNEDYIEKLDTNVLEEACCMLDDGTLLYACGEYSYSTSAELRYYDGNDIRTLSSNIVGYMGYEDNYLYDSFNRGIGVTEDQKMVVYTKESEDYTYSIYCQNISNAGGREYLVDSGTAGYALYDATHILYEKYSFTNEENIVEVYVGGMDVDPVKLADDADYCCEISVFTETGKFYYTVLSETKTAVLADYVTNPHAAEDAAAKEPLQSDYEETITRTDSWTGSTYTTTEVDEDAYAEAFDTWFAGAGMRANVLSLLEEVETTEEIYSLYCYSAASGESELITDEWEDDYLRVSVMSDDSVVIYRKVRSQDEKLSIDDVWSFIIDYQKVFDQVGYEESYTDYTGDYDLFGLDFNTFTGTEETEDIITTYVNAYRTSSAGNNGYYYSISGYEEQQLDTSSLDLTSARLTDVQFFDGGKQIAVIMDGNIFTASVSGGTIRSLEAANDAYEADSLLCYDNEELYYMIYGFRYDYDATLYHYRNDAGDVMVGEGIESGVLYEDSSMILWAHSTSSYGTYGSTLTVVNASGDEESFKDAAGYVTLSNGNIVMLSSDDTLQLYDGKEVTNIAYDVENKAYYPKNEKENGKSLVIMYY